jgi:hypothetical protein
VPKEVIDILKGVIILTIVVPTRSCRMAARRQLREQHERA